MIDFSELLSQGDANDMMQVHTIHTPGGEDISFSELCKRAGIESPPLFDDIPSVIPADDAVMQQNTPRDVSNGNGVTVTDVFGGQHHYASQEMANDCTDFFSGLPCSGTTPIHMGNLSSPDLPTDVHTPVDTSFYDDQITASAKRLEQATRDMNDTYSAAETSEARRAMEQAQKDIDYWNNYKATVAVNQGINNIQHDMLANELNKSLNDFNDVIGKL